MKTTDKQGCNALVEILVKQGVKRAVLSPGSRNAPVLMAFSRCEAIESYVVVDERTAAFMALGMSQRSGEPVALVCTSGTALLNYAPAVAEAYYQHIPLIVISGDRPIEWIDQDDGQTLRQYGALAPFVKRSYDLRAEWTLPTDGWYFNRSVNDALLTALSGEKGPVHINLSITEPLTGETEVTPRPERVVMRMAPASLPDEESLALLSREFMSARKVLVVLPQVVVLTESIANVQGERFISTIDRVYSVIDKSEWPEFAPDLLITLGGSLVSRMIKAFLRQHKPRAHWRISQGDRVVDTMQALTRQIETAPAPFIEALVRRVSAVGSDYSDRWHDKERLATRLHDDYIARIGWCDLKAFSMILPAIPVGTALQLSNGTTVRYAQLFDCPQTSRNDCNRGVCGIDGSTSTAAGASCVDEAMTLFITGDMSFSYDANGLSSAYLSPRFKVIVMCNGGGGIFRFIKPTAGLPELERCFEVHRDIPVEKYADLFGLRYFEIDSETSAAEVLPRFFAENERPAILAVHTPHLYNAEVLRGYFRRARQ